ncbi:MAG TPA: hypothetical protein DHV62_03440, partial [Elusimicrobia bacterium]|nr:hypothetical protein [Elusimicrobiota bacterium]
SRIMTEKGHEVEKIKLHRQIAEGTATPLVRLREKELELQGKLMEARKEAEIIVAEARKKATEIKRRAEEEAIIEA